jgi:hypothetical protein
VLVLGIFSEPNFSNSSIRGSKEENGQEITPEEQSQGSVDKGIAPK